MYRWPVRRSWSTIDLGMEQPKGDYSGAASHACSGDAPSRFAMVGRVCIDPPAPSPPCNLYPAVAATEVCLALLAILTGGVCGRPALHEADAYSHFAHLCQPRAMGVHEHSICAVLFDAGCIGLQRRSATAVIKHCGWLACLPLTGPSSIRTECAPSASPGDSGGSSGSSETTPSPSRGTCRSPPSYRA